MWELIVAALVLDGLLVVGASRYFRAHPIQPDDPIRPVVIFGRVLRGTTFLINSPLFLKRALQGLGQNPAPAVAGHENFPLSQVGPWLVQAAGRGKQLLAALARAAAAVNLPFLLALVLAILPPAAILCYRWLQLPEPISFGSIWFNLPGFISHLGYHDYFWLVFACALGLLALTKFFRTDADLNLFTKTDPLEPPQTLPVRRRVGEILFLGAILYFVLIAGRVILFHATPGIDLVLCLACFSLGAVLKEVDLRSILAWLRAHLWIGLAMLLAHVSLVFLLVQVNSSATVQWWTVLLFIASMLVLLRFFARIPHIFWIVNFAMALFSMYLNAWWYAYVGDEYTFYYSALEILQKSSLPAVLSHIFNGTYVYGTHPYFSSVVQAFFMKLLGVNNTGWRFSNVYFSAIAIFFYYHFLKRFLPNRLATIAACLLACSQYLIGFSKIGYNNLQAFFVLCLVLGAAGWAAQSKRPLAFTVLGLCLAACFYVFPGALYAIPIGIAIPLFFGVHLRRANMHLWLHLALALGMAVFPLFFQPEYWAAKTTGLFLPGADQAAHGLGALLSHLAQNSVYAFFSFVYRLTEGHFVSVSYMDMVSCVFIFLGLVAMLSQVFRQRFAAFWMLTFAYMLVGVGATHQYTFPPTSRMFLLLPWFCLLAAVGLEWVLAKASKLAWIARKRGMVTGLCLSIVLAANLVQALTIGVSQAKASATTEDLFLRIAQTAQALDPGDTRTYVFLTPPKLSIDNMELMQSVFQQPRSAAQMVDVTQDSPELSLQVLAMLKDPKTVLVTRRDLDPQIRDAVERTIRQTGRKSCEVSGDMNSYAFLILWFTPGQDALCW